MHLSVGHEGTGQLHVRCVCTISRRGAQIQSQSDFETRIMNPRASSLHPLSSGAGSYARPTFSSVSPPLPSPSIHTLRRQHASSPLTPASFREGAAATLGHNSNPEPHPYLVQGHCDLRGHQLLTLGMTSHSLSPLPSLASPARSTVKDEQLSDLKVPYFPEGGSAARTLWAWSLKPGEAME